MFFPQFCATAGTDSGEDEEDDVLALATVINLTLHKVTNSIFVKHLRKPAFITTAFDGATYHDSM